MIPAPDLFDGQVACSSNVPAGMANGPLATALAEVVMDGDRIAADSAGVPVAESPVAGLNYIIPPGDNNCGAGGPVDHDMDVGTDPVLPPQSPDPSPRTWRRVTPRRWQPT